MLVLFDFGTMAALGWMLFLLKKHPAWLMAYAWNPLVMKEISNGVVKRSPSSSNGLPLSADKQEGSKEDENSQLPLIFASLVSGFLLACGVGAKLFPVIFMPAMLVFLLLRARFTSAVVFGTAFGLGVGMVMWPMWNSANRPVSVQISQTEAAPATVVRICSQ